MDNRAMYTLSYGLFLLSAQADGFDNACIINTACQVTSTPNRLTIAVNNANFTTGMIEKSGAFNLSVLDETAPFSVFEHFGFRSGRDGSKLDGVEYARSENGLIYLPAHAAAYLSCTVESVTDLGTHKLFLAQVTDGETLSSVPAMTYAYYHANVKPKPAAPKTGKKGWRCKICGYVYEGETLPADFICPLCKHPASDFEPID